MPDLSKLTERSFGGLQLTSVKERPPYINMLIYGDPGSGKTVLAGSAAAIEEMSPVLVVDVEGGSYSLRAFYPEIDVVRVKTLAELLTVYQELAKGTHGYKTVVLDSLTEIQKMVMGDIMRDVIEEDADRDPDVPSIREWGKSGEQMRRIIRRFRDLDMHVIFTALVDEVQDKKGKRVFFPMLPGKLKKEAAGFMDIVVYMYGKMIKLNDQGEIDPNAEEAKHRFVLSSGTDEYVCKDRSSRMPAIMLDPTMRSIHDTIQGETNG
jgi:hypothetical protein